MLQYGDKGKDLAESSIPQSCLSILRCVTECHFLRIFRWPYPGALLILCWDKGIISHTNKLYAATLFFKAKTRHKLTPNIWMNMHIKDRITCILEVL